MKIKTDFVTNSSSSSFIIAVEKNEVKSVLEFLEELDKHPDAVNEGVECENIIKSINHLNTFTNGRPFDWASKPMGIRYYNLDESDHLICKEAINEGRAVIIARVDYNVTEDFSDKYKENIIGTFD